MIVELHFSPVLSHASFIFHDSEGVSSGMTIGCVSFAVLSMLKQ